MIEYLGMILNRRLTFSEHLRRARNMAIGRIRLSNPKPNPKTSITLYKIHICPILTYASLAWVTIAPSYLEPFARVQNRCLRLALHDPYIIMLAALNRKNSLTKPSPAIARPSKHRTAIETLRKL
ncbi:hypothetical protein Trydic_g17584 [Trypoxylus dichotomus]